MLLPKMFAADQEGKGSVDACGAAPAEMGASLGPSVCVCVCVLCVCNCMHAHMRSCARACMQIYICVCNCMRAHMRKCARV